MEFLSRHKRAFITISTLVCLVAIILTIRFQYRPLFLENALGYVITPAQKGATSVSRWVSDKFSFLKNIEEIEQENELLRTEVEMLREQNNKLRLIEKENKKLSDLLKIDQKYPEYSKVGAETIAKSIAKDMGNWFDTFIIDKGTKDRIHENMVVLASGGLVGRITKSTATYSEVVSIIDDTSSISAKCLRTEDLGFVKGDVDLMKEGLCRMDYLDLAAEIMEGDEIVTSNLGNIYPQGITIGYVKEIRTDSKGLTKYAVIQPVVDLKHIETVLIIDRKFNSFEENHESDSEK